jgi:peptidoglycan/LPS O-acetylase OafA/YrhL
MTHSAFSLRANLNALLHRPAGHQGAVDGIRAIAVLIVVASHLIFSSQFFIPDAAAQFAALPLWLKWPVQGFLGVDMFFVISGFLIGQILLGEYARSGQLDLRRFFMRRALRLMPLYWVALGLTALAVWLGGQQVEQIGPIALRANLDQLWKNLLYINNFFPPEQQFGAMSHSWSLAVEEQFYLLFPGLLLLFFKTRLRRRPRLAFALLVLLYLAARVIARIHSVSLFGSQCGFTPDQLKQLSMDPLTVFSSPKLYCLFGVETDVMFDNLYTKYFPLLAGVAAAALTVFRGDALRRFYRPGWRSTVLLGASLALLAWNFLFPFVVPGNSAFAALYQTLLQQLVFGAALANLILACLYGGGGLARALNAFLGARVFYSIAQLSYSMYLFNLLIVHVAYQAVARRHPGLSLAELVGGALPLVVLATVVLSVAAYLLVERPGMNLRARLQGTHLAAGAPAAQELSRAAR